MDFVGLVLSLELLDSLLGLGQKSLALGDQVGLDVSLSGGLGGVWVRGVAGVARVVDSGKLVLESVLLGGQLVLEVGDLSGISGSLKIGDQLLDVGLLGLMEFKIMVRIAAL